MKNPPALQEMTVQSLGQKDPWRRKWQPIPIFLPGKSPQTEEPAGVRRETTNTPRHSQKLNRRRREKEHMETQEDAHARAD